MNMNTLFPQSTELLKRSHYPVLIVGGGQAGLSVSYYLKQAGIDHCIFEKRRVASSWRSDRWDTFCLVTPNWQCRLPNFPYQGDDPKGFMLKDQIAEYVESFARSFSPPIVEGISVTRVVRGSDGKINVSTSAGEYTTDHLIVATGGYDIPIIPTYAATLPKHINQVHSVDYRNPESIPPGEVLVVGSGQSGVQIVEDLHLAGRKVHLCVGQAPRSPRVYRGKESTEWLMDMGYYKLTVDKHPLGDRAGERTNHYMTGRDGGHEIDLRKFAQQGVKLYGTMTGIEGSQISFAPDLRRNLDDADEVYCGIRRDIDKYIEANQIDAPEEAPFIKVWEPEIETATLDCEAAGITTIIWAIGFCPDYRWIELPAFDGRGSPKFKRGVSHVDGLYFLGLPWLNTWGSGRFLGVAEDAEYLCGVIESRIKCNDYPKEVTEAA
jgi:putative flavoprotein involved in K+ transport